VLTAFWDGSLTKVSVWTACCRVPLTIDDLVDGMC
jgi:hypothetical protein